MSAAENVAEFPPRHYEAIYILRPDVSKEASQRVAARVEEVVSREGGKLTLVENWGRRPMAYQIQHHRRGVYVYVNYLGNGSLVAELERNFRMLDEVIRFQTVKLSDDPGELQIEEGQTQFEAIEPPVEGEEEDMTFEQELGLVQGAHPHPRHSESSRMDDDSDDDDSDDDNEGDE